MLKKLLRYDLKSVFRYWWIAATASIILSLIGGLAISITTTGKQVPPIIAVLVIFAIFFAIIGIVIFPVFSYIMMYVRFYKNFFSDEGYLTFTLPVKRSQLLNSKLITSVITMTSSVIVVILDIILLFSIGAGEIFYQEFLIPVSQLFSRIFSQMDFSEFMYLFLLIIEFLLLIILSFVFSTLFVFFCITFAAMITKKAKVVTAIGIYYVANGAISVLFQLIFLFSFPYISERISLLPADMTSPVAVIILLGLILLMALVCMVLYVLNYFMIDRKLNLA